MIIENDDVTPMDFVVLVLLTIFELSYERAEEVMYQAHLKGRAYVATLPFEEGAAARLRGAEPGPNLGIPAQLLFGNRMLLRTEEPVTREPDTLVLGSSVLRFSG